MKYLTKLFMEIIFLLNSRFNDKNIKVLEVGFCKPRYKGKSKTSTNIIKLFSLSYPYIKAGILTRRNVYGKIYLTVKII